MGPHSQNSWLRVSWWEFSHPRGAKKKEAKGISVKSCWKEVPVNPGIWLKQNHRLVVVKLKGMRGKDQDSLFLPHIHVVQEDPYLFPTR